MAVVLGQTKRFAPASPVTRYWLANCVGFTLTGGGRGTVERVIGEDDPYVPVQLEFRHGNRLGRLPTSAVAEVIPAERVIVVRGMDRASACRRDLGRAAVVLGRFAVAVGIVVLSLATWLVSGGVATLRLVRSLPWQQYGRSVRSVTTRLWQDLSTRSSHLRTTSSARISAWRSSKRADTTSST